MLKTKLPHHFLSPRCVKQMSLYNAYSWQKLSAVRWRAKLHSSLCWWHSASATQDPTPLWSSEIQQIPVSPNHSNQNFHGLHQNPVISICYTKASKFQLSLKPTIYKLLLYTHLLEYVTHDFLQWHGDGKQQIVHIPLIRRAYTLHVHLSSTLMYCSFTCCHFNFFLLTIYKNGLKTINYLN